MSNESKHPEDAEKIIRYLMDNSLKWNLKIKNGVRWAEYEVVKILDSFLKKFRNFSQIDKKMKIKVDENLFSAIISVMTRCHEENSWHLFSFH